MKKILISLLAASSLTASAAVFQYDSLLSGYNVLIPTNSTPTLGTTNVLFTYIHGEVLYSLTNNMGNTNVVAADAFSQATLVPDLNGDIVANATVSYYIGNTNWIPQVVTNANGQYYVTNWVLNPQTYPIWMYPATTNYYPAFAASATNVVTISLFRATIIKPFPVWETTAGFVFTVTGTGTTPIAGTTNLPASFLQGANLVKASVTAAPNGASNGNGILLNALGIQQPVP